MNCFEWQGPVPTINNATEIHLFHTGWRSDEAWEQARMWFETVWDHVLDKLKTNLIRQCVIKSKKRLA